MKRHLLVLLFALSFTLPLHSETIKFYADSMSGNASEKSGYTTLTGNAHIITETMEIFADSIELSGTDFRFITASGNIRGTNSESGMTFTCNKMSYDRDTKIATLEGNVTLNDTENGVTAQAQRIEYDDLAHVAVMQISITLKQKDNTCTASYAIYRKDEQMLTLEGNPQVTQNTDTFRAQQIVLNLDTQEITLDGRVRGSVTVTKTQEEEAHE
ncbi:MAG TPA: organic solvent tolerance protein OstA [Treponema sp.]|nr:organic solvent tolerance protein OstA [Treponema sp.]